MSVALNKGKPNITADPLKVIFKEVIESAIPESEAEQNDLTSTFWFAVKQKIKRKYKVNIQFLGEVRTGKSTAELLVFWKVNQYIVEIGHHNKNFLNNIGRFVFCDQTEFLRFTTKDYRNVMVAVDEFNSMGKTGLNATTEEALLDNYSDVFAGQYIHQVSSSPSVIIDKNATYILKTVGTDEETGITRATLSYRDVTTKRMAVIGHVNFDVSKLIANWNNGVRDIVETKGTNSEDPEEAKLIDDWCKKDFYIAYQVKKYKRMDLLKVHGVRDIRELEYAKIVLGALTKLETYAKIKKVNKEVIALIVDEVLRKEKRIYSILGHMDICSKVKGILSLLTEVTAIEKSTKSKNYEPAEKDVMMATIKELKKLYVERMAEQNKLSGLYEEYLGIK